MRLFFLLLLALLLPNAAFAAGPLPWQAQPSANAAAPEEDVQEPESEDVAPGPAAPDALPPEPVQPVPVPSPAQPATSPAPSSVPSPATPAVAPPPAETGSSDFDTVILQGLNKVTAHTDTLTAPMNTAVHYGTITLIAHACWQAAPDTRPENAALLEVSEIKQGETSQRIFSGWMFSSNPGLSSLEHPFYDISVVACKKTGAKKP